MPTVAESSGPACFEVAAWTGLLAPRGTPKALVDRIGQDIAKVLAEAEVCERFAAFGYEAFPQSSAEMAATMGDQAARHLARLSAGPFSRRYR